MADQKISELNAITAATSDDLLVMVDTGTSATKKITVANFEASVLANSALTGTTTSKILLVGATASSSDFSDTRVLGSAGDTGYTDNIGIGVVGESQGGNARVGVEGYGVSTSNEGVGVKGVGATASASAAKAIGGEFHSIVSHASGQNCAVYANGVNAGGGGAFSFYGNAGSLYNAGDIYTTAMTDISANVTGLTGTGSCHVWYKKVGKTVFVYIYAVGTSNAITFTITGLPAAYANGAYFVAIGEAEDNSGAHVKGEASIPAGGTVITLTYNGGSPWTATNTKFWYGTLVYEATA